MGAIVAQVSPGGAAAKAGIEPGDVIVEYNGRPVANSDELVKMVIATKPGTTVPVKVLRNKQEKTLNVTVDELDLDAEQNAAAPRHAAKRSAGAGGTGHRQLRPDAGERDAADGAPAADAVGPDRRGRHRRRSGRPVGGRAAAGRRHPVGERQAGDERGGGRARAAEGRSRAASRSCGCGAATARCSCRSRKNRLQI